MNLTVTENGAPAYVSTLDHRLNLFFKTVRGIHAKDLIELVQDSWNVDKLDTLKILFNWRDCRGGKGDYDGFIQALAYLASKNDGLDWVLENLCVMPQYGRYLDWIKLWHAVGNDGDAIREKIIDLVVEQLDNDYDALFREDNISLLAKWLPSENAKWDRHTDNRFVIALCKELFGATKVTSEHLKRYRKIYLVPMRQKINLIETKLCTNSYEEIDYEKVPSAAMLKYKKAFQNKGGSCYFEYMAALKKGEKKIHADQVYPHDLVRHYLHGGAYNDIIEEQWKALKTKIDESKVFEDSMIVCDVSGSMSGTPLEVSIALGLLGMGLDRQLITFSEIPVLHEVKGTTLQEMVKDVKRMHWGGSTNFEKTIDLVLEQNKITNRIFVFSDMQFNEAFLDNDITHFESAKRKFEALDRPMPQIVFWNLKANTTNVPVTIDDRGVVLLSGYSPALLNLLLEGKDLNPLEMMLSIIRSPRYHLIQAPDSTRSGRDTHWLEDTP